VLTGVPCGGVVWCGGAAAAAPPCLNPWTPRVPAAHCAYRHAPAGAVVVLLVLHLHA